MNLSILHTPAAPFFFNAFEALPEQGIMTVPVRMNGWTNALETIPLTPQTVAPFASTLGTAITEIAREFEPHLPITTLPCLGGAWMALHAGVKHLALENSSEGKSLVFDRGAHLTRRLTGHTSGLALAVKRWGCFSSNEMAQALSLKHRMRWLPTAYEIKFEECAVTGLKEFLGLARETTISELGVRLHQALDRTGCEAEILVHTDLDPVFLEQGEPSEVLSIEVATLGQNQSLPAALMPYWNLSEELSKRFPSRESPGVAQAKDEYRELAHTIYGPMATTYDA
jgi:hypothetical protein